MDDDTNSFEDGLAALRAELDQAIAVAPEIARAASGYFVAFTAEGFSEAQALYLVAIQLKDPGPPPG